MTTAYRNNPALILQNELAKKPSTINLELSYKCKICGYGRTSREHRARSSRCAAENKKRVLM